MAWFPPPNGAAPRDGAGHGPAPSHPYRNHGGPIPSQTPPLHHHAVPPRQLPPPMIRNGVGVPAPAPGGPHHGMLSMINGARDVRNCSSVGGGSNPYGASHHHHPHHMMMNNQQGPANTSRYAYPPPPNATPSMPRDARSMRGVGPPRMGPNGHMAPFPPNIFRGAPPPPPRPMMPPHHASSSNMMMRMGGRSGPGGAGPPPMHHPHMPPMMRRPSDGGPPLPPSRNVAPTSMHGAPPPRPQRESPMQRPPQPTSLRQETPPPLQESRQHPNVAKASASPVTTSSDVTKPVSSPVQRQERMSPPTVVPSNPLTTNNTTPSREQDAASILLGLRNSIISSMRAKKAVSSLPLPPAVERTSSHDSSCTATTEHSVPSLASASSSNNNQNSFPARLSLPGDEVKLNSMHCFLRSELLELFVVDSSRSPKEALGCSTSGRVGLRCIHCHMKRRRPNASSADEAPMAVFYPKSLSEIYRLVTSWQRVHLRKCKSLPASVRSCYKKLKEGDKTRGKTQYWVDAAMDLGLVDCPSKAGGIRFAPPRATDKAASVPCSTVTLSAESPSSSMGLLTSQ